METPSSKSCYHYKLYQFVLRACITWDHFLLSKLHTHTCTRSLSSKKEERNCRVHMPNLLKSLTTIYTHFTSTHNAVHTIRVLYNQQCILGACVATCQYTHTQYYALNCKLRLPHATPKRPKQQPTL